MGKPLGTAGSMERLNLILRDITQIIMQTLDLLFQFCKDNQNLVIGVGLPIIIFLIQLWLWIRDHRTCDITIIENRNYILDPSLSNRVDGLSISYKDRPIENSLLYYQVTITNSGTKDISMNQVVSPLTLAMPDNVKLISCKVFDQSKDLKSDISITDNAIVVGWDLFKAGEYIRMDIIADYDSSLGEYKHDKHSLLSKITYNKSRIQDLKVQKTNIRTYEIFLRSLKTMVFICLIPFFLSIIYNRIFNQHETIKEYTIVTKDGPVSGQLVFMRDSVKVIGSGMVEYPVVIDSVQEIKKDKKEDIPKAYMLPLLYVWGFVLLEQFRMRRKRERYGLVSDKSWNQFDIEEC